MAAEGAPLHKKHLFGAVEDRADYASAVIEMFGSVMVKLCVFDASHYRRAHNEKPHGNARGELKRIDRLVKFENEVWVLDYNTGASHDPVPCRAQIAEYRSAMQSVYADKQVCCALIFAEGTLTEI